MVGRKSHLGRVQQQVVKVFETSQDRFRRRLDDSLLVLNIDRFVVNVGIICNLGVYFRNAAISVFER